MSFWQALIAIIAPLPDFDPAKGFPFIEPVAKLVTDFRPEDWVAENDNAPKEKGPEGP